MQCPICSNIKNFKFIESFLEYKLYECPQCSLVFSEPMKSLLNLYQGKEYYGERWTFEEFLNEDLVKGKLLDVGCAKGIFLKKAKEKGFEVYGFDLNPLSIQVAKNCGLENVYISSFNDFINNHIGEKFDIVTCFNILEHVEAPFEFIKAIKRIIKPSGILVLVVPNNKRWHLKYKRNFYDYPPYHLSRWNRESLNTLLLRNDFSIIKIKEKRFILDNIKKIKEHIKNILLLKFSTGKIYKTKIYFYLKPSKTKKYKISIYNFLSEIKNAFIIIITYILLPFCYFLLKNKKIIDEDLYVMAQLK